MTKPDPQTLKEALQQFTGTETWHRCALNPHCLYTDGVEYFVDQVGGYWILDILATEFFNLQRKAGFLVIKLTVEGSQADLVVEDGDYHVLTTKHIEFTDCPEGVWEMFFTDDVILLNSEY